MVLGCGVGLVPNGGVGFNNCYLYKCVLWKYTSLGHFAKAGTSKTGTAKGFKRAKGRKSKHAVQVIVHCTVPRHYTPTVCISI